MIKLGYYYFEVEESSKEEKRQARRKLITDALHNVSKLSTILQYVRFWENTYYQNGLLYK